MLVVDARAGISKIQGIGLFALTGVFSVEARIPC